MIRESASQSRGPYLKSWPAQPLTFIGINHFIYEIGFRFQSVSDYISTLFRLPRHYVTEVLVLHSFFQHQIPHRYHDSNDPNHRIPVPSVCVHRVSIHRIPVPSVPVQRDLVYRVPVPSVSVQRVRVYRVPVPSSPYRRSPGTARRSSSTPRRRPHTPRWPARSTLAGSCRRSP